MARLAEIGETDGAAQWLFDLQAIENRVARQRDALIQLTGEQMVDCDDLPKALPRILEVVSSTLDVSRVSIWRYTADHRAIECVDLYDAGTGRHSSGQVLEARDFPAYFAALATTPILAVDDAINDPRTAAFAEPYLRPLRIASMMDAPVHMRGAVVGVLCHEQVGEPREWTSDEKSFAVAVSNLASLAFERCERARAEKVVRLQAEALNAAADATMITDRNGVIAWINPAFTALTGYLPDEAIGQHPRDLLKSHKHDQGFYAAMLATVLNGGVWRGEIINRRKNGEVYVEEQTITPVTTNGAITHFIAIKRDLTDRRRLEAQFQQAQKMEVVGRLAGGVAHDFNNLLTVINGSAELALADLGPDHPLRRDLEQIQSSGRRAAGLTRQLLAFSRKQLVVREPVLLDTVLAELRRMLQRLIGEDINLTVEPGSDNVSVLADRSQLEQVVMNLAVNARDAMPAGGALRIVTRLVTIDAHAAAERGVMPGRHVQLTVSDTGHGIAPDILPRIFEPFFTTKEIGKGTGLGLATVYAIVQQAGGTLRVASEVGMGATFTIEIPASDASASAPAPEAPADSSARHETILVVEDEDEVRDLAAAFLRGAGYRVRTAANARDAIAMLAQPTHGIDLIVTDVVMPGMSGRGLAEAAATIHPQIPVLFTSGYTEDEMIAHGVQTQQVQFLPKPFSASALREAVRSAFARRGPGGQS